MNLGIDASTAGSGGARRHLIEILNCFEPTKHGFSRILIWGHKDLLDNIPSSDNIIKHSHPFLNKGLFHKILWQLFYRDSEFKDNIDVLFSPFGTYIGNFRPYVTMSRNMLVFDKAEQKKFGFSWYRLKFILLFYIQRSSFRNSQGLIFISNYAKEYITKHVNYNLIKTQVIHHGISKFFKKKPSLQKEIKMYDTDNPFILLYVSTVFNYKNQINVVEAFIRLRNKGIPVVLNLIGGVGEKKIGKELGRKIVEVNSNKKLITWVKGVELKKVVDYYHSSDLFIFASTCENMPNILIEAMASGLPIACSASRPMPEFLENAGLYFNPENIDEIEETIEKMIKDPQLRESLSKSSFSISNKYSWENCADKTFDFLKSLKNKKNVKK